MTNWIKNVLPLMRKPFTLITGDEDNNCPNGMREFKTLLDSPLLKYWYGQNYDGYKHPKMRAIPIGFDLHSNFTDPLGSSIEKKLESLIFYRKKGLKVENKKTLILIPPMGKSNYRKHIRKQLELPGCVGIRNSSKRVDTKMPITEMFDEYSQAKFVISPQGHGIDTHRAWEVLWNGAVPIVRNFPGLALLYEGLPFLVVRDYQVVCKEGFLENKWNELVNKKIWPPPLSAFNNSWWLFEKYGPSDIKNPTASSLK